MDTSEASKIRCVVVFAALLGSGSGDDQPVDATKACLDDGGAGPYFLYRSMDWFFLGATDYPDDLGTLGEVEPSLDWFAEYEHHIPGLDDNPTQGASLRLSGHDVALATQRKELVGFQTEDTEIAGRRADTATGPDGEPTVRPRRSDCETRRQPMPGRLSDS